MSIENYMLSTACELPGYRIIKNVGMDRGIVVRSRSIFGTIGGGPQTLSRKRFQSSRAERAGPVVGQDVLRNPKSLRDAGGWKTAAIAAA